MSSPYQRAREAEQEEKRVAVIRQADALEKIAELLEQLVQLLRQSEKQPRKKKRTAE